MDWRMDWTAIGSIATAAAVLVALFGQDLQALWRAPILTARLLLGPPDSHKTFYTFASGVKVPVFYIRTWVTNEGKTRAEDVQVMAANLLRRSSSGSWESVPTFQPMNLRWTHQNGESILDRMPPGGMGRHCDVAHVIQDPSTFTQQHGPLPAIMELDLEVTPNTGGHRLPAGEHLLELRVGAGNVSPISRWFHIRFGGTWHEDEKQMFGKELRIDACGPPASV